MDYAQADELLTTAQAAAVLGLKSGTLEVWRTTRRYSLPFVKIGRSVKYRRSDLIAFIERQTVAS